MKRLGVRSAIWLLIATLPLIGCGRLPGGAGTTPVASPSSSTSTSPSPSSSPSQWAVYTDADYHFSISYPAGFVVERHPSDGRTGLLISYRAVDAQYANGYPPGQLEFVVYAKDADTLEGWVAKHSGPTSSTDITRYWTPV